MSKSKYKPEYCEALVNHGKQGLSFDSFAATIGVSRQSIYDWEKIYPEFREAKELSKNFRELLLEKLLIGSASGRLRGSNAATLIFTAKNILGWRDTITNENIGDEDKTIKIELAYNLNQPREVLESPKQALPESSNEVIESEKVEVKSENNED